MGTEGVGILRCSAFEFDGRHHTLAETLVGHAGDGARYDARRLVEHPLDLGGIHVGAAPDNHEALSIAHVEVPIPVEESDISRAEFSVAQRFGGRVGSVPVPEHEAIAVVGGTHTNLPGFPDRLRRTGRIGDADGEMRQRSAARALNVGAGARVEGDYGGCLAQPVGGEHRTPELSLEHRAHGLGAVGAAGPDFVEREQVAPLHRVVRSQTVQQCWRTIPSGHTFGTDPFGDTLGIDAIHHDRAALRLGDEQGGEHHHVEDREG